MVPNVLLLKKVSHAADYGLMELLIKKNRLTFTAVAVVAVFVLIAATTRFVLLGIFPVLLSFRAFRRDEQLAPLAVVAALVAVVIAVTKLSHQ
jgi:hypothetical protein